MTSTQKSVREPVIPGYKAGERPYELAHPASISGPVKWQGLPEAERDRLERSWLARMNACTTWAKAAGVKLGSGSGDGDPEWLLRKSARKSYTGSRPSWLDHGLFWVSGRQPAAITASLYGYEHQQPDIERWLATRPGIGFTTGPGWYHSGTLQIVLWRKDVLGERLEAADAGTEALSWLTPNDPPAPAGAALGTPAVGLDG